MPDPDANLNLTLNESSPSHSSTVDVDLTTSSITTVTGILPLSIVARNSSNDKTRNEVRFEEGTTWRASVYWDVEAVFVPGGTPSTTVSQTRSPTTSQAAGGSRPAGLAPWNPTLNGGWTIKVWVWTDEAVGWTMTASSSDSGNTRTYTLTLKKLLVTKYSGTLILSATTS
ncbi:MAG: hypothetical protein K1X88_29855 [Nannocystaceae bacterium]|nr:hypothetical protein [Nannocystaceae bacterium]